MAVLSKPMAVLATETPMAVLSLMADLSRRKEGFASPNARQAPMAVLSPMAALSRRYKGGWIRSP